MLRQLLSPTFDEPPLPDEYALLRFSRRAMATGFEIDIPLGTPDAADAADAALNLIDELEDQLSIYRVQSEVSRLNASAFEAAVAVEPRLFELLQSSARLTQITGGAFDIACGALIAAWGFHRREGRVPPARDLSQAMQCSGMKHVLLNDGRVRFLRRGLALNLGSIGKGYALDRAGAVLKSFGIRHALLHAGGSSVLALGRPPNDRRGWPVAVSHPACDGRTLGTVRLSDAGFATSAATYQHFEYNGRKYGHVLDPRTGWPADAVASASVTAATAAEADALATAAFVAGKSDMPCVILPSIGDVTIVGDLIC